MRKMTSHQQAIYAAALNQGTREGYNKAVEEVKTDRAMAIHKAKLDRVQAVTAFIEAQTKAMSRTGYLVSQLNKDKGW